MYILHIFYFSVTYISVGNVHKDSDDSIIWPGYFNYYIAFIE